MPSDVRRDINRAMQKREPDFDMSDITWQDAAKGGAAIVGGALAGRWAGKRIRAWLNKRNLGKHAMDYVKRFDDTRRLPPPDSRARFRRKV